MDHPVRTAFDVSLGTSAATAPIWLEYVQNGTTVVVGVGGAILVVIRVWIAIRELRNSKQGGK